LNHDDHVALIENGIPGPGGTWADFGSGDGAFTLALAELIGSQGEIYSIDKDAGALRRQARALAERFPERAPAQTHFVHADFSRPLDLPRLDGVVMANALHFHREKDSLLQRIYATLRPRGRLILVEYNADRGNLWVPYPLSYPSWEKLAGRNGFINTRLLARRPSRFLHEIYSALSVRPEE
jgi:ubiquinone/menaquinone biosynthesis C-methylase UbiE